MMVVCFVVIDLIMLVVFSAVEGSRGKLGADRVLDKENEATEEGVRSSYLCTQLILTCSGKIRFVQNWVLCSAAQVSCGQVLNSALTV